MQTYSPFEKAIKDLQPADLAILNTVSEGWYVEYKSELVNARALAKAVSAFANTYGGWLFLGVQEQDKDDPVAGSFPGIPNKDVDSALQRLRHSAAEHLNPSPHFETKIFRGPCEEIGLNEDASIVAIKIPQSHTAPHVHKDGRIYRRVADGSEPKPETDRFILDQLWSRSKPIRKMTRKWIDRDPEFSEAEAKTPYVRLLFCVDPWRQKNSWLGASLSEIRSILNSHEAGIPSITFETVYTTAGGIIARHVRGNDPHNFVLTWKIRRDMSCDIVLPLPLYTPHNTEHLIRELDGYDHDKFFIDILKEQEYNQPRIADLNFMMSALIGVVSKYRHLLRLAGAEGEFYCKARALNVWRVLPFIDIKAILEEFQKHGLPISIDSTLTVPTGVEPESFLRIDEPVIEANSYSEQITSSVQAGVIFAGISMAFGILIFIKGESENEDLMISYDELRATADRAMIVQQNRNQRHI